MTLALHGVPRHVIASHQSESCPAARPGHRLVTSVLTVDILDQLENFDSVGGYLTCRLIVRLHA